MNENAAPKLEVGNQLDGEFKLIHLLTSFTDKSRSQIESLLKEELVNNLQEKLDVIRLLLANLLEQNSAASGGIKEGNKYDVLEEDILQAIKDMRGQSGTLH